MTKQFAGLMIIKEKSVRLPNKNIFPFNGKPMFLWNLEKCTSIFEEVYVSSDSYDILSLAVLHGAKPIHRGDYLCGDCPDIPVFQHALSKMNPDIEGVIAVHADTPLLEKNLIIMTKKLLEMGVQEVMTCKPMTHGTIYKDQHHKVGGSIRGMSRHRLENYLDFFKPRPNVLLVDTSIEIETPDDLIQASK